MSFSWKIDLKVLSNNSQSESSPHTERELRGESVVMIGYGQQ